MTRRLALTALLAVAPYALLLLFTVRDPSKLIVAGDLFTDPRLAPRCLHVEHDSGGYDGQFYYRLAVRPFAFVPVVAGIHFDYPVYRQQRIGYPLLASLFALGDPCRVIWALIAVNLLALAAIGWAGGWVLERLGAPAYYGAVLAIYPGFVISFCRSTAEITVGALLLMAVALLMGGRYGWAAGVLAFAALTRETSLIPAAVLGIFAFRKNPAVLLLPPAAFLAWKTFLFHAWQLPVDFGAGGVFAAPFTGIAAAMHRGEIVTVAALALFVVLWLVALSPVGRSSLLLDVRLAGAVAFVFVMLLSNAIWIEDAAYLRALSEFALLATLVCLTSRRGIRLGMTALYVAGWCLLVAR
jgi:hypothetical protein